MRAALLTTCLLGFSAAAQAQVLYNGLPANAAPSYASSGVGTMYASTCSVSISNNTLTSTFCPNATDPNSVARRTYPAGALTPGKSFSIRGGGVYSVPAANALAANIQLNVGTGSLAVVTPAAPVGTNADADLHLDCTVQTATTIACHGAFVFTVAGTTQVPVPIDGTVTFSNTTSNLIDLVGDWNGTTTTQIVTVTNAILTATN